RDYKELSAFHQYFFNLFLLRLDSLRALLTFPAFPRNLRPSALQLSVVLRKGANTKLSARCWQVFSGKFS
ncbi:hypothetical protein, partial [Cupriavidus basilensis]|uniref:hypothetical protein n=1 Tax=Cupriavidus basilensis TaxID=68895 RepID=UPI0020A65C9F